METSAHPRKTNLASILALLLFLYVGSYCWLRFGVVTDEMGIVHLGSVSMNLSLPERMNKFVRTANFLYSPCLRLETLIARARRRETIFVETRSGWTTY